MGESSNKYIVSKSSQDNGRKMKDDILRSLRLRTRERNAQRRDTESRMTQAQREAVNEYENRISQLKTERMGVIDSNGDILLQSTKGSKRRTKLTLPYAGYTTPNAVLTHNHPTDYDRGGIASRVNTTFSPADIKSAAKLNVKALRVKSQGGYIYQLERTGDKWPSNPDSLSSEMNSLDKKYMGQYSKVVARTKDQIQEMARRGDIIGAQRMMDTYNARINVAGQHKAMKELAKKYGLRYTYRKA